MVLNTTAAVETFMHHGSITLGGNVSGNDDDDGVFLHLLDI